MEAVKEILIGLGVGIIRFGMLKEDVKEILGKPDSIDFEEPTEEKLATETWEYFKLGLSLTFDEEENWKLETITISSDFYTLFDEVLIGKTKARITAFIEEMQLGKIAYEDYSSDDYSKHELIDVDEINLFFWFDDEKLTEIQMGVLWENEETPIWPILN